jgi:hypothetical protein
MTSSPKRMQPQTAPEFPQRNYLKALRSSLQQL